MKYLLHEGFRLNVNRGITGKPQELCSNTYKSLLAQNVGAVEQEQGLCHAFPAMFPSWCPDAVAFMTVIRDPVDYAIRRRWDFESGRMHSFTLPSPCRVINGLRTMGGHGEHLGDDRLIVINSTDVAVAKTVLERFAVVCITADYRDCPLIMAHKMKLAMTQADVNVLADRYLQTGYTSQNHTTGQLTSYFDKVMVNGAQRAKQWVRQAQDILKYESELFNFAKRISRDQFNVAKQALQAQRMPLFDPRLDHFTNMSHVLQIADSLDWDSEQ